MVFAHESIIHMVMVDVMCKYMLMEESGKKDKIKIVRISSKRK